MNSITILPTFTGAYDYRSRFISLTAQLGAEDVPDTPGLIVANPAKTFIRSRRISRRRGSQAVSGIRSCAARSWWRCPALVRRRPSRTPAQLLRGRRGRRKDSSRERQGFALPTEPRGDHMNHVLVEMNVTIGSHGDCEHSTICPPSSTTVKSRQLIY